MAKRKKKADEGGGGLPGWMATFSDMVTLLLTFFVLLLSMANFEDVTKVEAVLSSIKSALGANGFDAAMLASHVEELHTTEQVRREDALNPTEARLRQAFEEHISDDLIRMVSNEQEIRVRLDDRVLFAPGSTDLHPAAYALVSDVATIAAENDVEIRVEGHTDASGDELDNWRVSSERAMAVVTALRERGPVPGDRLEADAFGEFRPASAFGEDARWNRRVELVLKSDDTATVGAIEGLSNPE
ncbi:MAG: OmpA family protein [Proteobacteria bacterium]|nr:OmpA family protein [Pseudomonadota bacterium]MCP4919860.1 OmpA family protein [Pseudomonadota bacterium]